MGGRSRWRLREKARRLRWRAGVEEKLEETLRELRKAGERRVGDCLRRGEGEGCERAVRETAKRFGKMNVLVNNAGALSVSTIEGISEEEWDRLMATNLKGPFLMCRAALPEFRKRAAERL